MGTHQQRTLNRGATPARALIAVHELCAVVQGANCLTGSVLGHLEMTDSRAAFRERVLSTLRDRGLITEPQPHTWRLTPAGLRMVEQLQRREAGGQEARDETEPSDAPIVQAGRIDKMAGTYDLDECNFRHVRPGSLEFMAHPSRRGNELVYRDGRRELIEHGAPQAQPRPRRLRQWDLEQVAVGEVERRAA